MKLADIQVENHSVGIKKSINFTIAANAKMFQMLSNALYSNKISAPLRELSTNCLDSHIEAGCQNKPFDVHLPNNTNTNFIIRDYGTGLSLRDLTKLYTI
jgi:HSP90 family molecular chaperone